jgi:hypothetical protein
LTPTTSDRTSFLSATTPVSPGDDSSERSFLHKDGASTSDYEVASSLHVGGDSSRQRNGFKRLLNRKPTFFSLRRHSTFDGNFAQGKPGWWKKQMLVDRSLRSMAAFTAICALIMLIIVISYLPAFAKRLNRNSTSVGGNSGESCASMESKNIV